VKTFLPATLSALLLACSGLRAGEAPEPPFKLTVGSYQLAGPGDATHGTDLNLRHTSGLGNAWLGAYRQDDGMATQWRAGWDRFFLEGGPVRVQLSAQAATGGFWGGSAYAETGTEWYAGAGLGRTNLRPYVNLNFDPNDAITLAVGRHWAQHSLGLTLVADNRENPDQRHLHLTWRTALEGGDRLTLDLLAKRGLVDGARIERVGLSATYDHPRWFARVAWDPKVNFSAQDMTRLALGVRF
jgi:hypothetical protein